MSERPEYASRETFVAFRRAVMNADESFQKSGDSGTSTWLAEHFEAQMEREGLVVVARTEIDALRAERDNAERRLAAMTERYRIAIDMSERVLAVICELHTVGGEVVNALHKEADRIERSGRSASPARVAGRVEE